MGCASCAGLGHFGSFVPADSFYSTTGRRVAAPNDTAGMHRRISGLGGMETYLNFSPLPTDWITGVPNGFVVVGGVLLLVMSMR